MSTSTIEINLREEPDPLLKHWVITGSLSSVCRTFLGTCFFCKNRVNKYTAWDLVEETESRLRCPVCKTRNILLGGK